MILSMTGFGRGTAVRNGREITVELRSVNSRYFEYSSRMPRTCSYLDSRLKKQLNERISRGKVELSMTVQNVDAADTVVAVNMELARSYQQAMRDISEQLGVKNDISAGVLTRFPDVLTTRHADVDEEQLWEDVSAVTAQALDRFVEMRAAEGAKMKADVENRLNFLEECVGKVETLSAGRVEAYTSRLYEKLKTILEDRSIDDARVLTEAAIFGDKTPISSLKSYFGHTLGACGAIEAWLALEMMQEGWFAPTINLTEPDPACAPLDHVMGSGRMLDVEYLMSNNFAFGGINTSLIFKRWG